MRNLLLSLTLLLCCFADVADAQTDSVQYQEQYEISTFPDFPLRLLHDVLGRPYLYAAMKTGGLRVYDVSNQSQATLVATIPISALADEHVMDVYQHDSFLYLALGNFFGTDTQPAGIAIIDVSVPQNAVVTDFWVDKDLEKGSSVVVADDNFAYLGAMTDGIKIFNVADKQNIELLAEYLPDPNYPVINPSLTQRPNARGMTVQGNVLYLCNDAGGLRIINVADKQNPVETNRYLNAGVTGKQQAYNWCLLSGTILYVGIDYCGMEVLDVSDTSNILQLAWWNPWQCEQPSNIWTNSPGHGHQVLLDTIHQLLLMSAGASELVAIDVSDPQNPVQKGSFGNVPNNQAAWSVERYGNEVWLGYITAVFPFFSNWAGIKKLNSEIFTHLSESTHPSPQIGPNPFTREINCVQCQEPFTLSVTDILGNPVRLQSIGENRFLPLSVLAPGVYISCLSSSEGVTYQKLIHAE